jgi:hypothetical protein
MKNNSNLSNTSLRDVSETELATVAGGATWRPSYNPYGGGGTRVWRPGRPPYGPNSGTGEGAQVPDEPQTGFQSYEDLGSFFS